MRIVLVADDYYPQLGGVPEHVHHLALELNRRGHQATIVTAHMRQAGPDPDFVRRIGTSIVIRANGGVARVTAGWRLRNRLEALFRELRADVVHVHGGLQPTFGIVAPAAANRAGIPVVATFHTWFARSVGYRTFRRPLQRLLDRHAATIAVSRSAVSAMSRYFRADWEIIPNGVDLATFRDHPGAPGSEGSNQLLYLGRLEPRNGLDTLLAALPRVVREVPGIELVAAGDGPWGPAYRKQAERDALPVRFLGQVFGERPRLYRQADLYLCPVTRASFGVTLLEAMACGTPMVVSDLPAFREVAGREAAALVPPSRPEAWADTIVSLLASPERRRAMREAGVRTVRRFGWPSVTDRLLAVYQRVVRS
jgi:phosphatidylinositol alpha-mannosyltransferase